MPYLSNELHNRCRSTLLACSEFNSDGALRAMFVTAELRPFRDGLSDTAGKKERVDMCLDYLLSKRLSDGRPILPLFLATLASGYERGDALRDDLDSLAAEIQGALGAAEPPLDEGAKAPLPPTSTPRQARPSLLAQGVDALRNQRAKLAGVAAVVILLVIALIVSRNGGDGGPQETVQPTAGETQETVESVPTATPDLPALAVILSANLTNCDEPVNLANVLTDAVESVDLGEREVNVSQYSDKRGDELVAEAERLGALAAVWGECVDAKTWVVTIALTAPSAYPVSLLREPTEVTLRADSNRVREFVRAGSLYTMGQYGAAFTALEDLVRAYADRSDKGAGDHFFWLWGNVQLRLGEWSEALTAYTDALNSLAEDAPLRVDLLANRGLASLYAAQASGDVLACGVQGREDMQEAVQMAPERPDLQVLLGTIMLLCPQDDQDIEQNAGQQAEQALALDPDFAPAYVLKAQIGEQNQAIPEIGDPLLIQEYACTALELDRTLPGPHRTLGIIYAEHSLADRARAEFEAYARSAPLEWQRQDAGQLMKGTDRDAPRPAPAGLGRCE